MLNLVLYVAITALWTVKQTRNSIVAQRGDVVISTNNEDVLCRAFVTPLIIEWNVVILKYRTWSLNALIAKNASFICAL
jgi:hypothetical protein